MFGPEGFSRWSIQPILDVASVAKCLHVPAEITSGLELVMNKTSQRQNYLDEEESCDEQILVPSHCGG